MKEIVLIAHDMRSCHNVGSLLRTAEGLGVAKVFLTGYTPYPIYDGDIRLPHLALELTKQIDKTALGAQNMIAWQQADDVVPIIKSLQSDGFIIAALGQTNKAILLPQYKAPDKIALLLGREVEGITPELIEKCDVSLEIPMYGRKESFNVVQAAAMAIYHCRFGA